MTQKERGGRLEDLARVSPPRPEYIIANGGINSPAEYWRNTLNFVWTIVSLDTNRHNANTMVISMLNDYYLSEKSGKKMVEFLDEHYEKYCSTLTANEDEQIFFDYLIALSNERKDEFLKVSYIALHKWVQKHPDYNSERVMFSSADESLTLLYDKPNNLTFAQIALILVLHNLPLRSVEAEKLLKNNPRKSLNKLKDKYDELIESENTNLTSLEGSSRTNRFKNLNAVYPYLRKKAREMVDNEVNMVFPKISLPV